jgi:hypothetical protein
VGGRRLPSAPLLKSALASSCADGISVAARRAMDSSKMALTAIATMLVLLRLAHVGAPQMPAVAALPAPPVASDIAVRCAPVVVSAEKDPSTRPTSEQREQQGHP